MDKSSLHSTEKGKYHVFISYKRENVKYVARLVEELDQAGIRAWFDINELHQYVGEEYTKRIHDGIDSASLFLLIYTHDVETSDFIIQEEVEYALQKGKSRFLFYPKDKFNPKTSRLNKRISDIQWLDSWETSMFQPDSKEAIHDEEKRIELSTITNQQCGYTIYEDKNIFLIRVAIQRILGKKTPFGKYTKLCGTDKFYGNDNLSLRVVNKALFLKSPARFEERLNELGFYHSDKEADKEIAAHIKQINPDTTELKSQFMGFLDIHKKSYSLQTIYNWLKDHLHTESQYLNIELPGLEDFCWERFIEIVTEMVSCTLIRDLEKKKTLFNGAMLGVYDITDNRTSNSEFHSAKMELYYSDYFTFKCMTEMYHILCSIDASPFNIQNVSDIKPLAPFLCSLGLGGFLSVYSEGEIHLLWAKRSAAISSGDIWHFSYDETVSLYKDANRNNQKIIIKEDASVDLVPIQILFRALKEELGIPRELIEDESYGIFEIGIIQSERLEIELISNAVLHFNETSSMDSMTEQLRQLHDASSDGYLEISKLQFIPIKDSSQLIGRLLTPESLNAAERLKPRLHPNVGKKVSIGDNTIIDDTRTCYIDDGAIIGKGCKIHRNVYIGKDVKIGDYVKIQNNNSIYDGVELEDGVFVGTNVSFINDRYPRSIRRSDGLPVTRDDWKMEKTLVRRGASIGAGAVILCGVTIGEWAMIGCGAVVLEDVPAGATVVGNPAKIIKTKTDY